MLTGLDALVARDEIRQLAYRYAWYLDSRDIDGLAGLFARETQGDGELHATFTEQLRPLGPTTLFVGNHLVDLDPDDEQRARGIVYCRAYISEADGFVEQMIVYSDRYVCEEGAWRFIGRRHELVYGIRTAEQPFAQPKANWPEHSTGVGTIPFRLESWQRFVEGREP